MNKTEVERVIQEKIRPYLAEHQGDIELYSIEDGTITVRMLGKCAGCPSAQLTVEDVVERVLKEELPEIKKVMVVNVCSQELLDMAKKLLRK